MSTQSAAPYINFGEQLFAAPIPPARLNVKAYHDVFGLNSQINKIAAVAGAGLTAKLNLGSTPAMAGLTIKASTQARDTIKAYHDVLGLNSQINKIAAVASASFGMGLNLGSFADSIAIEAFGPDVATWLSRLVDEPDLATVAALELDTSSSRTVHPLGLGAYEVQVMLFLMIVICMLSVKWDDLFGSSVGVADRAIALTEVLAVAGLPTATIKAMRIFLDHLRR